MPWLSWSFTFRAYIGAVDPLGRRMLDEASKRSERDDIIDHETLPDLEIKVSTQIFYILAMTCKGRALSIVQRVREGYGAEAWRMMCREFEPRLPSRFQGMLQSILMPARSQSVESIYNWEQKVRQYEEQSGDTISSTIKTAVLTTSLVDADLQRHLNLQAGRLTTSEAARKEAVDYLRTKAPWTEDDPMDLGALPKGKGKGDKDKGKGKGDKGKKGGGKSKKGRTGDGRFICYAYNTQGTGCNGSCGMVHICANCESSSHAAFAPECPAKANKMQ